SSFLARRSRRVRVALLGRTRRRRSRRRPAAVPAYEFWRRRQIARMAAGPGRGGQGPARPATPLTARRSWQSKLRSLYNNHGSRPHLGPARAFDRAIAEIRPADGRRRGGARRRGRIAYYSAFARSRPPAARRQYARPQRNLGAGGPAAFTHGSTLRNGGAGAGPSRTGGGGRGNTRAAGP